MNKNRKVRSINNIKRTADYWLSGSKYDLETADVLLIGKKYPYALFMGHLALEKLLKALVVQYTNEHAPYTHSLPLLASKLPFAIPDMVKDKLAEFMEFHIESRYPDERKTFYNICTSSFTRKNIARIKEIYKWLSKRLKY